jgi:hypothetical protein
MGSVLELVKSCLCLAAFLTLSACGSPLGLIAQAALDREDATGPDAPVVNREAIKQADLAVIIVKAPAVGITTVTVAIQKRDDLIIYSSNDNRGVVMHGGLVYATLGFGTNLQAVITQQDDPLVANLRPAAWPETAARRYQIAQRGVDFAEITANCSVQVGPAQVIDVSGLDRNVAQIKETCQTNSDLEFENVHFVDTLTGQVWRSVQWTGPMQGTLQIDIVEQFE